MRNRNVVLSAAGAEPPIYVEDVFSTYLYTGSGSTQNIYNYIDLSTYGGMVWLKRRDASADSQVFDTIRGVGNLLATNQASGQSSGNSDTLQTFATTGFAVGSNYGAGANGGTYASWTFRKQKKFFDVVSWSGNSTPRSISHNLGSVPGMIIVKGTNNASANWAVYHKSLTNANYSIVLNSNAAQTTGGWFGADPTSSVFYVGTNTNTNETGTNYIAYLFADDAGGFGTSGGDSIIKCGSITGTGARQEINLGWEPQFIMYKLVNSTSDWVILDNMRPNSFRSFNNDGQRLQLAANLAADENTWGAPINPYLTSTGMGSANFGGGNIWIYVAIRRGPMKTPTTGTSVFATSTGTYSTLATVSRADMVLFKGRNSYGQTEGQIADRLRGYLPFSNWVVTTTSTSPFIVPSSTAAEATSGSYTGSEPVGQNVFGNKNSPLSVGYGNPTNVSAAASNYSFVRAPGFFDAVCYSGQNSTLTINHNLGVTPQMMIIKNRSAATDWLVMHDNLTSKAYYMTLNSTSGETPGAPWYGSPPTSTQITLSYGGDGSFNTSGYNYIAYLFASVAGVSKVGTFTIAGSDVNVDCGFTNGARFVLLKSTGTSSWLVLDTARGIASGSEPALLLNSTAAETSYDWLDPYAAGFTAKASTLGGASTKYIYLAIA